MTNSRNKMHALWATLAALQAAGVTPDDASWPLLRGLDISTAADVLATLQVPQGVLLSCALCVFRLLSPFLSDSRLQ